MKTDLLTQLLGFFYSIAHYIGLGIVKVVQYILPSMKELGVLVDPIGFLAVLSLFVVLVSAARKIGLIVLAAGWALILVRIILLGFGVR